MPDTLTTDAPNAVIVDQGLLYFRAANGEIFAADAADNEVMKKIRRGVQPLLEYGQFGSSAYYMDNPYEPLFQAGGAREMPVKQVVELGYHLRPPLVPTCGQHVGQSQGHLAHVGRPNGRNARELGCWANARPVQFPQLEHARIPPPPGECDYCGRDDFATEQALHQHQSVMHADRRQQVELADGIVAGLQRGGTLPGGSSAAEIAAAVVIALRQLERPGRQPDPEPEPEDDEDEDQPEAPESEPVLVPEDDEEDEDDEDDEDEDDQTAQTLREQVAHLRAQGLSQRIVAARLGISRGRVARLYSTP